MVDQVELVAERLERATEPDRKLFINAYESIHGSEHIDYAKWERFERLLNAGAWLDASMSLAPEGKDCNLWWGTRGGKVMATAEIDGGAISIAAAAAFALCAAALRSRTPTTPERSDD